jgi:hypothetical protein
VQERGHAPTLGATRLKRLLDLMYLDIEIDRRRQLRVAFLPVPSPATARWKRTRELPRRCG